MTQRQTNILTSVFFVLLLAVPQACSSTRVVASRNKDLVGLFAANNTKFVIKEDIDLGGKTIRIGKGCTLDFHGGSFMNGAIVGNNTKIKAENYEIFRRGSTRYRAYKEKGASEKMPPTLKKEYRNSIVIEGTWSNKVCGINWTGLLNDSKEDVMLAIKNYVTLHQDGVTVKFPAITALGFETTYLPGNHVIDFSYSTISYPDNLEIWVDNNIAIPPDANACAMETGYGLISMRSNTTIKNLTLDGKSQQRQEEPLRLGVSCLLSIGNAKNINIENVTIQNALGPAMTAQSGAKNITFMNCRFSNIGEHVMYSHQYLGFCHFEECTFDTWDSERISVFRNGMDYVYKHTPPSDGTTATYDELYHFDLQFNNCSFYNPKRVNSQGRNLGGFITGSFPAVVKVNGCKFIGIQPPLNPGGGADISEKSGKNWQMIVRNCDSAPTIYPSKVNYNIVVEYYDCKNLPFRTVYAKCYERCTLTLDIFEDNIENVSPQFEEVFSEPLLIRDCTFTDRGRDVIINHPIFHRPIRFDNCQFNSEIIRNNSPVIVVIKAKDLPTLTFHSCEFNLPSYRLVGGDNEVEELSIDGCKFNRIQNNYIAIKAKKISSNNNVLGDFIEVRK